MKAARLLEFGGPGKLVYGDYAAPEVGAGDVLVKLIATSVSRWDVKYRTGEVHEFYRKATGHHGGIAGDRVVGLVHPENPRSNAAIGYDG